MPCSRARQRDAGSALAFTVLEMSALAKRPGIITRSSHAESVVDVDDACLGWRRWEEIQERLRAGRWANLRYIVSQDVCVAEGRFSRSRSRTPHQASPSVDALKACADRAG